MAFMYLMRLPPIMSLFVAMSYSTVTDFAKFLGLSTSVPRAQAV